MNKKEYKQPSLKVIKIDSNDIICTSPGDPSPMNLFDEEVDDSLQGSTSSDIWGKQW